MDAASLMKAFAGQERGSSLPKKAHGQKAYTRDATRASAGDGSHLADNLHGAGGSADWLISEGNPNNSNFLDDQSSFISENNRDSTSHQPALIQRRQGQLAGGKIKFGASGGDRGSSMGNRVQDFGISSRSDVADDVGGGASSPIGRYLRGEGIGSGVGASGGAANNNNLRRSGFGGQSSRGGQGRRSLGGSGASSQHTGGSMTVSQSQQEFRRSVESYHRSIDSYHSSAGYSVASSRRADGLKDGNAVYFPKYMLLNDSFLRDTEAKKFYKQPAMALTTDNFFPRENECVYLLWRFA